MMEALSMDETKTASSECVGWCPETGADGIEHVKDVNFDREVMQQKNLLQM